MKFQKLFALITCAAVAVSMSSCNNSSSSGSATATAPTTVSVETPVEVEKPADIGKMSFGTAFYKPLMGAVLYNVDISSLPEYEKLVARCVQGLVSRNDSAQIYLSENSNDTFWLNRLKDEYGIIVKDLAADALCDKFAEHIKNIFVYDDTDKYAAADAVYQASLQDSIAVPRDKAEKYAKFAKSELTVTEASSTQATTAAAKADGEQQTEKAKQMYAAVVSPDCKFVDYLYALGAPVIFADAKNQTDINRVKTLLSGEFEKPAVLFCEDNSFIDIASENGFGVLKISGFSNATCFSSFSNSDVSSGSSNGTSRYSDEIEKYVSIEVCGDNVALGDSLSYIFKNSRRGSAPVTVEVSPALCELAPPIASWYAAGRRTATSISADSLGYMSVNPAKMKSEYLETYYERSKAFISMAGLNVLNASLDEKSAAAASSALGGKNIIGAENNGINVIKVDSIYNFKDYKLPDSDSPFYCIKIKAGDITTSTFQQLENLVLKIQEANENTEFVMCEDLFPTVSERLQAIAQTTTAATTAAQTTAKK